MSKHSQAGKVLKHPTLDLTVESEGSEGFMDGSDSCSSQAPLVNAVIRFDGQLWETGKCSIGCDGRQLYLREDDGTTPSIWWDADDNGIPVEAVDPGERVEV